MTALLEIPEIQGLDARGHQIRIPQEVDIPLTPRVRRLIDTEAFQRLNHISQLGLVSLVYPAAHHTRFEHSLGVYRVALLFLKQLSFDSRFAEAVSTIDAEKLIVAALLHDVGHWPFCHPIEDMQLLEVPDHEELSRRFMSSPEVATALHEDWNIDDKEIVSLLCKKSTDSHTRLLQSLLSGPIDIDKMDYLARDSLHAGVPYGRNFDQQRLIGSLCLNRSGDGLAITEKGRTAAEMMVFARYVMFSEVYWHHAVRSATAMLQRAFYLLRDKVALDSLFELTEQPMIAQLRDVAGNGNAGELLAGLFGTSRRLYKRMAQFSYFQDRATYEKLARKPYPWLVECATALADRCSQALGQTVATEEILIDAPPIKLEVEFNVDVYFANEDCYRSLGEVSPVVQTLAHKQFDDYVKRVRIFVHPDRREALASLGNFHELVHAAAADLD
ncbi:MAG: HD domain-containing protein [Planctomycetota bacterium]|nr:HD domain-containing protein [Planctomycetota bacterium]